MEFTAADHQSLTWIKLKAHILERLDALRETAGEHADPQARAETVGRIKELHMLVGFEQGYIERVEQERTGAE